MIANNPQRKSCSQHKCMHCAKHVDFSRKVSTNVNVKEFTVQCSSIANAILISRSHGKQKLGESCSLAEAREMPSRWNSPYSIKEDVLWPKGKRLRRRKRRRP